MTMVRSNLLLSGLWYIVLCHLIHGTSLTTFEYELPNRTVTICPTYSLISLQCPQIPSSLDHHSWQSNLPQYLISVDFIRSYPSQLSHDISSCQADLAHPCHSYDLRYLNTLCNGKAQCPDIPAYQIRDRSLCAFKAVTEIGYHCVPTWHLNEIKTKCDICKNGSLTNDYGFIYSRNYPSTTVRLSCFTTIYARPNHKTILYFVSGELNYDELRIESVTADGLSILNITLNGNLTTQRLAISTYEMKITFTPSHIYSHHPTYYLLYFYTIPLCSVTEPCPPPITTSTTTMTMLPFVFPSTTAGRARVQSIGWTRVPNIWIIIPIILAYVLLLLLVIVLALFFQRRRKQRRLVTSLDKSNFSSRYLDTSGVSSQNQLANTYPLPHGNETFVRRFPRAHISQTLPYPVSSVYSFADDPDRYHRESRSDHNLHQNTSNAMNYRPHPSTNDFARRRQQRRRSLPKSFSDCDLCKRRVLTDGYQSDQEQSDTWHWQNSLEHDEPAREPRPYREKIKERYRERVTMRPMSNNEMFSSYAPHHQRSSSESTRLHGSQQQLPFEYIPAANPSNSIRLSKFGRNSSHPRLEMIDTENLSDVRKDFHDRSFHDAKEVQEISMRMNEQFPYSNRYPYEQSARSFANKSNV